MKKALCCLAVVVMRCAFATPSSVSVTPSSGSGSAQNFAFLFSDPAGYAAIVSAQIEVSATLVDAGTCYVYYSRAANQIYLYNDAGNACSSPLTVGVAGTVSNSQCMVNAGASSVTTSGDYLTLNLALSFLPAYVGARIPIWRSTTGPATFGPKWARGR